MQGYNGVIETATGFLLKSGFCDFSLGTPFDPLLETYKTNIPYPSKIKGQVGETLISKWTGATWVEVAQP